MLKDAEDFKEQDKLSKEKIDAKNSLENYIYSMKNSIDDPEKLQKKLDEDDKKTIKDAVKDAQDWLENNKEADKETYEGRLKELEAYI